MSDLELYSPRDLAQGAHISGWHNWSEEGYIGCAVAIWEYHTEGSPALADIWDRWSIRGDLSTTQARHEILLLCDSLDAHLSLCCAIPEESDDADLPYCKRCASMHIAVCAALAIVRMMSETATVKDCVNAVRFAHGKHLRFEGARDGFGQSGRYAPRVAEG